MNASLRTPILWLSVIALGVFSGCEKKKVRVDLGKSEVRTLLSRVSESGVIQPTIDVPVAPDVSGEVVYLAIQEGMQVKKGDLLVTIRPDDYKAQLEQTEASLSRAQAGYLQAKANLSQSKATVLQDSIALARTKSLFGEEVVSQVDLENAQLKFEVSKSQYESAKFNVQSSYYQVKSAEATRKQSRQNLDRTNIYASMDGTITKLNVELGQRVVGTMQMAGTEILKIADLSRMEVVVEVNENDIIHVSIGDSALVEVDAYPDRAFFGKVSEVAYSASTSGVGFSTDQVTNFEVKVVVDPASYQDLLTAKSSKSPFRPGMTSLVEIYTKQVDNATVVPIQAVTLRSDEEAEGEDSDNESIEVVFTFDGSKVSQVPVTTGISDGEFIEVVSGLGSDVEVVTGPYTTLSRKLEDGMIVQKSFKRKTDKKWEEEE
ncbi:efflux RND transporter periplasmic adaptor subunit [Pontibacter sp. G13]|uniref:efflux RND transporter periplasmic adaptor subunit n=1 Tax=Pontibacter sp. G13 TaxID=3074898 RepID=UPI00288BE180|nr:efflux RND transporter periplasmic adaptor subunit [Pontibacter sp. G13]WNJ21289.1 efflux RND transporter periplasmic adaptor subunit [Pontibacter sp. G13]